MQNQLTDGLKVTVPAPAGGVTSGDGVLIGSLFGVASATAAAGADVVLVRTGTYTLPKFGAGSGAAWTVGQLVYWDASEGEATHTDDSAANKVIGVAAAVATTTATTGAVLLTGQVS